jgi:hypothetical protein
MWLEPGCTFTRRIWRRAQWWNGRIRLHGQPYCASECFEHAAGRRFARLCAPAPPELPVQHRIPLGLLMLARGQLTNHQLHLALEAQKRSGRGRIGEWLETFGFASEPQITSALGVQWACPVFASSAMLDLAAARMLPYRLLASFRMCPVQFVERSRTMYVSFGEGVDHAALYAIEQMLECRTEPGLVGARVLDDFLEQLAGQRGAGDLLFESWRDPTDMARITCGYVRKFGAQDVRIVGLGSYIWARLQAGKDAVNLLFRLPAVASGKPRGIRQTPSFLDSVSAKANPAASR